MEEELITFETAKLAKEKKFNEPSWQAYGVYSQYGDLKGDECLKTAFKNEFGGTFDRQDYDRDNFYLAPTQSLLQKWLREVHGIIVEITWQMCSTDYEYAIIDMNNPPKYEDDVERIIGFKAYEETLEEGLYKALKLIK